MTFIAQLSPGDTAGLDQLQRILLVSDGTLTDILEAAFAEPICVRKLSSELRNGDSGDAVFHRRILLAGQTSGRVYLYAESEIMVDRLPAGFKESLVESQMPLGRLWVSYKIETRKELINVSRTDDDGVCAHFDLGEDVCLLRRSYRVISQGRPVMVITEWFPERYR